MIRSLLLISGHVQLSPKGGDNFHSLIYLCFRNNQNVKTGQFTHTPQTNQNKTTATRNKTFHAKWPYVHPGMELENSETSKKHNNNLLREQQMSIVLNRSNIYPLVGIFLKNYFLTWQESRHQTLHNQKLSLWAPIWESGRIWIQKGR